MAPSQLIKHLSERSPVTSEDFAYDLHHGLQLANVFWSNERKQRSHAAGNCACGWEGKGLTEGLESDIVRGYLELEVSLRVVCTPILGQIKSQSAGRSEKWRAFSLDFRITYDEGFHHLVIVNFSIGCETLVVYDLQVSMILD